MIQQTNLSFLKCFFSFPSLATMRKGRERKKIKRSVEREIKLWGRGREVEHLSLCVLVAGTHGSVVGNKWVRETKMLNSQWHRRNLRATDSWHSFYTPLSSAQGLLLISAASSHLPLCSAMPSSLVCIVHYSPIGWLVKGAFIKAPQISDQSSWGCRAHICSSRCYRTAQHRKSEKWIEPNRNNHILESSARTPSCPAFPSFPSPRIPTPAVQTCSNPNN